MTVNEAHVRAVAEALSETPCVSYREDGTGAEALDSMTMREARLAAEVAVATLTPLIAAEVRAEVAATAPVVEIVETLGQPTACCVTVEGVVRFMGQSYPHGGDFWRGYREGYIDADNGYAARIATEEAP